MGAHGVTLERKAPVSAVISCNLCEMFNAAETEMR